jgi:hypothetical protein
MRVGYRIRSRDKHGCGRKKIYVYAVLYIQLASEPSRLASGCPAIQQQQQQLRYRPDNEKIIKRKRMP